MNQGETTPLPGLRGALVFYILTFVVSWVSWGLLIVFPQMIDWSPLIILLGAYGPFISASILSRVYGGAGGAKRWFRSVSGVRRCWRMILLGGLFMPLMIALTHLVAYGLFVGEVALSVDPPWYWAVSAAPINVFLLFWWGSAMEEYGWQGFALPRLTEKLHPLAACLLHGILWATWHLPLYLTHSWSGDTQPIWLLYGITITLAPTMFGLTNKAIGSVLPAVLLHAATNHYSALFAEDVAYSIFQEPLTTNFEEIKTLIYLAIALLLVITTRGWLGLKRDQQQELDVPLKVAPG